MIAETDAVTSTAARIRPPSRNRRNLAAAASPTAAQARKIRPAADVAGGHAPGGG